MSATESNPDETQYEELAIDDETLVIYDVDEHRAWIQSDTVVPREEIA